MPEMPLSSPLLSYIKSKSFLFWASTTELLLRKKSSQSASSRRSQSLSYLNDVPFKKPRSIQAPLKIHGFESKTHSMDVETLALEEFVVGSVPTVFYLPDYVTAAEEDQLLNNIYKAPISKWKTLKNRRLQNWGGIVHDKGLLAQDLPPWLEQITQRIYTESRLFPSAINHVLINEYRPDQGIMPHQDGPAYVPVVAILSLGSPVIMNFTPHPSFKNAGETTGDNNEMISEPAPLHTNCGGSLSEYHPFSVALMPRSLLIFKDAAYSDYLHGIEDSEMLRYDEAINVKNGLLGGGQIPAISDFKIVSGNKEDGGGTIIHRTGTRISLTCRVVAKVHKSFVKLKI